MYPEFPSTEPSGEEIPIERFTTKPTTIEPYRFGDAITRENFISLVILSFAISRGNIPTQKIFLTWLGYKFNFNFPSTFKTFTSSGGWDCLSEEEKATFNTAFDSVKRHDNHKRIVVEEAGKIEDSIKREFDRLADSPEWKYHDDEAYLSLFTELNSISDFRDAVAKGALPIEHHG